MIVRLALEDANLYPLMHIQMHVPPDSDVAKYLAAQGVENLSWHVNPNSPTSPRVRLTIKNHWKDEFDGTTQR